MKHRKHRLVIEATFSQPLTEEDAIRSYKLQGDFLAVDVATLQKEEVKSFRRVVQGLANSAAREVFNQPFPQTMVETLNKFKRLLLEALQ